MEIGTQVDTDVVGNTKATTRSRGYILTINNPTENDFNAIKNDDHTYACWQVEQGENGTKHIQALIFYKNPRVFPKKKYPRAHIERARNVDDCIKYCMKEDTRIEGPWEQGERPQKGRRTDLEEIAQKVITGTPLTEIAVTDPSYIIRYSRGLTVLKNMVTKHRTEPPEVIWLWGEAGVGKTRYVFDNHTDIYMKDNTMWWDGYEQNEVICIDDFCEKGWPFRDFLRLLDRYPYQGQIKGGYVKINSKYIYITCEFSPEHFWNGNELKQVTRRIKKIDHLTENSN